MCVIYATGEPRHFEFAKAEGDKQAPDNAIIFAACDGKRIEEQLDADVFEAMSDGEYYELQSLIGDLRCCEFIERGCPYRKGLFRKLWRSIHSHQPSC